MTGEEGRYSHTDLYDIAANLNGSARAFQVCEPTLATLDKDLEDEIEQGVLDALHVLNGYQRDDGSYASYAELIMADKEQLQALLATLREKQADAPGVLGM